MAALQGDQGLEVTLHLPQSFPPQVKRIHVKTRRVAQPPQRLQRMLGHAKLEIPLGFALNLRAANANFLPHDPYYIRSFGKTRMRLRNLRHKWVIPKR